MSNTHVVELGSARQRRVARAVDARRRLDVPERRASERPTGRAWVNGIELGGTRAAFAHLAEVYD